jgi:hypothetical protein
MANPTVHRCCKNSFRRIHQVLCLEPWKGRFSTINTVCVQSTQIISGRHQRRHKERAAVHNFQRRQTDAFCGERGIEKERVRALSSRACTLATSLPMLALRGEVTQVHRPRHNFASPGGLQFPDPIDQSSRSFRSFIRCHNSAWPRHQSSCRHSADLRPSNHHRQRRHQIKPLSIPVTENHRPSSRTTSKMGRTSKRASKRTKSHK